MTADVPETAQRLASELADAFETDRGLAEQLTAAQTGCRLPTASCGRGCTRTRWGC